MTKPRSYGSGTIHERSPGVWRIRVPQGSDPLTGKRLEHSETFRGTRKEATIRCSQLVAEHSTRTSNTRLSLKGLLDAWLETADHATGTRKNYERSIRLLPATISNMSCSDVSGADLARLYRMLEKGQSPHTIRCLHAAISAAYTAGVGWGWVTSNPARSVRPPSIQKRLPTAPSVTTLGKLLAEADDRDPQIGLWLQIAVETGARRGEVLGIQWADVDFETGTVWVRRSIEVYTRRPKDTKAGRERPIPVSPTLMDRLKERRNEARAAALEVGLHLSPGAYVLSEDSSSLIPWRPDTASRRFHKLCKAAECPGVRLHDLRHAMASVLLNAGFDVATVSERLGHSQVSTTLNVYTHVLEGRQRSAADFMGKLVAK